MAQRFQESGQQHGRLERIVPHLFTQRRVVLHAPIERHLERSPLRQPCTHVSAGKPLRAGVGLHIAANHAESAADPDSLCGARQRRSDNKCRNGQ